MLKYKNEDDNYLNSAVQNFYSYLITGNCRYKSNKQLIIGYNSASLSIRHNILLNYHGTLSDVFYGSFFKYLRGRHLKTSSPSKNNYSVENIIAYKAPSS
ncbi:MAG: hypothetical protein K8R54_11550 [Bacteroidales bacterium]|nr:hypothetical protein [Bacteroidales bacterium]